ncbi:hypothetical protein [Mycolicibacterium sp.]|uniref:hypothetical protein n=1 Tax=Mycolicibacterium sp. TaxID=2320850 RepID=UPI0037C980C1
MNETQQAPCITGADSNVPGWDWGDRSAAAVREATYTADERDLELLNERQARRRGIANPLEGDYIEFADGATRRARYVDEDVVQTSAGGSWHLAVGGSGSFSGALYPSVPRDTLHDTKTTRPGPFWFFHHDWRRANNAVYALVNVRVWSCSESAPR